MPRCPRCHRRLVDGVPCSRDGGSATRTGTRAAGTPPGVPGVVLAGPLGVGGFGVVWEGRRGDATVAVKVGHGNNAVVVERFSREAEALRAVGPPHVPVLVDQGVLAGGQPYLVLERLRGETLATLIEREPEPPALPRAAALADAILASLEAVHAHGLTHRDLKPENIWLRPDGSAALLDFGLARLPAATSDLTRTGAVLGTPEYAAPEQLRGERDVDARADLYAFGVILYELLTQRPPFVGDGPSIEHGHLALRPLRPGLLRPLPQALEELALALLAKEPSRRPTTAAEVRRTLAAAAAGTAAAPPPPATARRAAGEQPVALLWIETQGSSAAVSDAVGRRGGWLARQRGSRYLAAWAGERVDDPALAARAAADEIVTGQGGRAALRLASVSVRLRGALSPVLAGEAVDKPETWVPPGEWEGVRDLRDSESTRVPLIGRDAAVAALAASAGRCLGDGVPGLCTLVAARGLGKSRLLDETAARLPAAFTVLRIRGGDPARDLLARLTDTTPPAAPQEVRLALGEALRARAAAAPLAVLLDDGHRADDVLLDALEYAVLGGSGLPLWVALAALPAFDTLRPRWGLRVERHDRIDLPPLDPADAAELAAGLLLPAEYPPAQTLMQLVGWTDGNPLYLTEAVAALKRAGLVRRREGAEGLQLATELVDSLPQSPVLEWLAVRQLAELSPPVAACARLVAVLGAELDRDELERLVDAAERAGDLAGGIDAGVGLAELEKAGVLRREGNRWAWRSTLVRDGIYGRLAEDERVRLHRHALHTAGARPEARARHAGACGERAEAADAHLALGAAARAAHRPLDAELHYSKALAYAGDEERRLAALHGRGRVRYRVDRAGEAVADLAEARELARRRGDRPLEAHLLLEEATALDWMELFDRSRERVDEARPLVEGSEEPRLTGRLRVGEGRSAWRSGKPAAARAILEEAIPLTDAAGDSESRIIALLLLAPIHMTEGRPAEAAAVLDEVLDRCGRAGDRLHLGAAYLNRCFLALTDESASSGLDDLRRVVEISRADGRPWNERVASFNLAELMFWSGEEDESLALARRTRFLEERFIGRPLPHTPLLAARIQAARGDLGDVDRELAWLAAHGDDDAWRPSDRLLFRALQSYRSDSGWDALLAEARAALPPEELLELLYWQARARPADRARVRAEAEPLLGERPFWRRRYERLA